MTETTEAPQATETRPRDPQGRFAPSSAYASADAELEASQTKAAEGAREVYERLKGENKQPEAHEASGETGEVETEVDDEPSLALTARELESLKRDLGLSDDDLKGIPGEVARSMAARSAERQRQLDDLHRQNREALKERGGKEKTESAAMKPSADEPVFDAAALEPLRELLGDNLTDRFVTALSALGERTLAAEQRAQAAEARVSESQAMSAVREAARGLSGELPELVKPGVLDRLIPTIRALGAAEDDDYGQTVEDVIRAAYRAKFGPTDAKRANARDRQERELRNQVNDPGVRSRKSGRVDTSQLSPKERARIVYDQLGAGKSTKDAQRAAGLG